MVERADASGRAPAALRPTPAHVNPRVYVDVNPGLRGALQGDALEVGDTSDVTPPGSPGREDVK